MFTLAAKPAASTISYDWTPGLGSDDSIASVSLSVTTGTATISSHKHDGKTVTMLLAGGAAGVTSILSATVLTQRGQTITETIYLPVTESTNRLSNTARDICSFALRKMTGIGEQPEAEELDDALERLNIMLAAWKPQGADIGIALPVEAGTVFLVPDEFILAIKANLLLDVYDAYGEQPTPRQAMNARMGLQLVKSALLSDERAPAVYY